MALNGIVGCYGSGRTHWFACTSTVSNVSTGANSSSTPDDAIPDYDGTTQLLAVPLEQLAPRGMDCSMLCLHHDVCQYALVSGQFYVLMYPCTWVTVRLLLRCSIMQNSVDDDERMC